MKVMLIVWAIFNGSQPAGVVASHHDSFDNLKDCLAAAERVITRTPQAAARCFVQLEA